ncbi:site-specific DNA-methyltransferase, partial [Pseudovibrio sp. POLY-S9]|uniref:site-specific DNA-methyltransferase n=1 Tax=Pseudovibrio sp. POLY-S9 TaxID=1576596 RepID=UPI0009EBDF2A
GSWRNSDHPTEKPLPLMCQLIGDFTNRGDTILDPFMGSGTTGAAALLHGRKFIGIEQDEAYFNYAVHRLEQIVEGDLLVRAEGGLQASIFDEVAA